MSFYIFLSISSMSAGSSGRSDLLRLDEDDQLGPQIMPPPKQGFPEGSNNPFRQQRSIHPQSVTSPSSSTGPPLPARKVSIQVSRPDLPPRNSKNDTTPGSSSSSFRSISSSTLYPPTSTSTPSSLIQQSLAAAVEAAAQNLKRREDVVVQVVGRSSNALSSHPSPGGLKHSKTSTESESDTFTGKMRMPAKSSDLIAHVSQALKEAEGVERQRPPRRKPTTKASVKLAALVRPHLDQNPDTKVWSCTDLLSGTARQESYAMIILNQPITRKDVFLRAWDASER